MPTVPIIEKDVESRPIGAPQFSYLPTDRNAGVGLMALGKDLGDVAQAAKQRADQVAITEAQQRIDEWESINFFGENGAFNRKGKNAVGVAPDYIARFDADMQKVEDGLANEEQKILFQRIKTSRRGGYQQTLNQHEQSEMRAYDKSVYEAGRDSNVNRAALYWNRDDMIETAARNARDNALAWGKRNGVEAEEMAADDEGRVLLGALTRMSDNDPKRAVEFFNKNAGRFGSNLIAAQRLVAPAEQSYKAADLAQKAINSATAKTTQDEIVDFVIDSLEGGEQPHPDGNGRARWGINSKANPDVDLDTLTREEAVKRYKDKYWDGNKIGDLPAQMRLPVFQAYVNGWDKGVLGISLEQAIKDADGDPMKFLETQARYYQKLGREPEHRGQLKGWMGRISKVAAQVQAARGALPTKIDLYEIIDASTDDPQIAETAKTLVNRRLDAIEKIRKEGEDAAAREAVDYQLRDAPIPPSVQARMNPEKLLQIQKQSYDPLEYERVRAQVSYGVPVDLNLYLGRITPQQTAALQEMQRDPKLQDRARVVDGKIRDSYYNLLGKPAPATDADFQRIADFRKVYYDSIEASGRTGKPPDDEAIKKIGDRLLKDASSFGGFLSDDYYETPGIPQDRVYRINGHEADYATLQSVLHAYAQSRDIPATPENMQKVFLSLKNQRIITEGYQ